MQRDDYPHPEQPPAMIEPALHFVDCEDAQGGHRMAYWQWGDPASPHLVACVHGLTRQGRDFDVLARALVERAGGRVRVVCPDIVGRGKSDWLKEPANYQPPVYAADMLSLFRQLNSQQPVTVLDYVGTSMGGLIGMLLAGYREFPLPAPIRRLVLNDVGPALSPGALQRIGAYVGQIGRFADVQEAADAMWALSTTFGPHTPAQWLALSRHMVVPMSQRSADGRTKRDAPAEDGAGPVVLHYDPAIALPLRAITPEVSLQAETVMWALYDAISAQTLLVRGAVSDLLSKETALAMTQRGPRAHLVEFEGVGHAPTFVATAQSAVVASFLWD